MFGSICKYAAIVAGGALLMAVGMHYNDDKIIAMAKQELDVVKAAAKLSGDDVGQAIADHVIVSRPTWVSQLILATSIASLDSVIDAAKA